MPGIADVIAVARAQVGKPYVWGAAGPDSFDCSGLTKYAYFQGMGKFLPHNSEAQFDTLKHRPLSQKQPGDILFWRYASSPIIHHCALYIGNDQVVEAKTEGIPVQVSEIYSGGNSVLLDTVSYIVKSPQVAGRTLTKLPYPADSVHPPLTVAQRVKMITWLLRNGVHVADITGFLGVEFLTSKSRLLDFAHSGDWAQVQDADANLITIYNDTAHGGVINRDPSISRPYEGPGSSIIHGVEGFYSAIEDFVGIITSPDTWIRVGEGVAGLILVGVAVSAISKGK